MPNVAGLTQHSTDVISTKVETLSSTGKMCVISMDEISLKSHLFYDSSKDKVIGLEDFGDGITTDKLATSAIVLMARGIIDNWKQPLAYYLVNESCSSEMVKEKLTDAIDKLEGIGLNVLGVVSDIGSNFQKFVREMGITPDNPWFVHNGKKILYIFDAPHIIKAIRNNLMNYNFHFDDKVACWNDLVALYKIDSNNSIRSCPKLTHRHMSPNGFLKMKVKLATQVLSHSVAAAMMMAISGGLLPASATGTAEMVSQFDEIFDCLNSSTFSTPKESNRPMTASSKHIETMKEKLEFVKKIKVIDPAKNKDVTASLKCLKALQITLSSTMELWKTIQGAVKFLCTRRLNQDPLENFFGSIRQQGGNCDNPTPLQFTQAFRKLFFNNYLLPMGTGNCAPDLDSILVNSKAIKKSKVESKEEENSIVQPVLFKEIQDVDYNSSTIEENLISNNATTYVCGYLLKKCLEKHSCETCSSALVKKEFDSPDELLCYFKAYETDKQPFGGLTVPVAALVQYILKAEQIFIEAFPNMISKPGIAKQLISMIPKFQMKECKQFPSQFMVELFVRMRLHYILKFGNRDIIQGKKKGKNRKYFKVSHL
jgi:hypothetical protein